MKKNGQIDFLKFFFAVVILVFHTKNFETYKGEAFFTNGSVAGVSFFFIVSGYLMVSSYYRLQSTEKLSVNPCIGTSSIQFIFKKIKSMMPNLLVAWFVAMIVESFLRWDGISGYISDTLESVFELLFLTQSGMMGVRYNTVT